MAASGRVGRWRWLIIDDTALPKKGKASVGVAPQYATVLGKNANCQTLVSVTLASGEVPVMLGLRLYLPESWTSDTARMERAGVPEDFQAYRTKPDIAIKEIDRVIAAGVRFGCVLADAGYGLSAPFRQALSARGLRWAVGIPRHQKVYPADVQLIFPVAERGRPRVRHVPDGKSRAAHAMLEEVKWAGSQALNRLQSSPPSKKVTESTSREAERRVQKTQRSTHESTQASMHS